MNFVSPRSYWLIGWRKEQLKPWLNVFTAFTTVANGTITYNFIKVLRIAKPQSFGSEKWFHFRTKTTHNLAKPCTALALLDLISCRSLPGWQHFISKSTALSLQFPFWTQDSLFFPKEYMLPSCKDKLPYGFLYWFLKFKTEFCTMKHEC